MPKGEPMGFGAYDRYRRLYRDLERRRADVFYSIQWKERSIDDLKRELGEIDTALDWYQAAIKEYENKGAIE